MSQFSTIVRPLVAQFIQLRLGITCAEFTPPYSIQHAVYQRYTKVFRLYKQLLLCLKPALRVGRFFVYLREITVSRRLFVLNIK